MDSEFKRLVGVTELQEKLVQDLEEELKNVLSGENSTSNVPEELKKLMVDNEKLKYRINILKKATKKEENSSKLA